MKNNHFMERALHQAKLAFENNEVPVGAIIVEDGKIGAKTLQAVNQIKPDQLLSVLKKECETFYTNLATKNPELKKFLNGWLKRADS